MNEQALKYLKNARAAREEDNSEDAKKFYDMVRIEDPENGEAKFFYQYYSLYEGKNGELPTRFNSLTKVLKSSVRFVAESGDGEQEKMSIISSIVSSFVPMTWSLNRHMNSLTVGSGENRQLVIPAKQIQGACIDGVIALYELGDIIEKYFKSADAKKLSALAWKEAVSLNQKWYAYNYGKSVEEYVAKIQKIEPDYVMPKKAGCISFSNSK